ncbi:beta-N-acetylhexosaminidase [Edaphobacter sp. 12200R-103]|uniref:beta-N-acetylhexosaminidase n=1 Tax=Edaphobacter sp. 12200R-103 TaxID=2703788 RepID=UPI00138B3E13|nr:family 20 glycosylhydrolase [Edaphobacter sp. 12200R-103]QHS51412.1 family 20 glycosylhydrolase [Edaphobacter sp. 12200R-103]
MSVCRKAGTSFLLLLLSLTGGTLRSIAQQSRSAPIIPEPADASRGNGMLNLNRGLFFDAASADPDARSVERYLQWLLERTHNAGLIENSQGLVKGTPQLRFVRRPAHQFVNGGEDESYSLKISPASVVISASNHAGYLYGAISLWQMLAHNNGQLAVWQIEDEPRFRWRGLMLDSARHMQSEKFILELLDYMAEHKLNRLHWHLTDDQGWRIEIKRYPRLTSVGGYRPQTMPPYQPNSLTPKGPYGGFYTQEQIRRIVAYAQARNIIVVPEIEMPGHATAPLVAYPEYASSLNPITHMPVGWGIYPNLYNPKDETFTFLENILTEVMELFPSEYIHVGGDEAIKNQWKENPAIQQKLHELGLHDEDALQSWFIARIEKFINAHGRKMVGWDEILQGGLSQNATVMSWRGMEGGIAAARQGHDAILTPYRPLYFNYRQSDAIDEPAGRDPVNSLGDVYNFRADPTELTPAEQSHILGVQGSIWTEYILTEDRVQHMLFPRAAALAEMAWSPAGNRNYTDFLKRLPADLQRAKDAGLQPALSVFEVQAHAVPAVTGDRATLTLSTQGNFGEIHYTLDGSSVGPESPVYTQPVSVTLPRQLHALAFEGGTALGDPVAQQITLASAVRRDSRELDPCRNNAGIQMEQDPPRNAERPVFRVVFSNPCWIYRKADLGLFQGVQLGVGSIPYIFHAQGKPLPVSSAASTTNAKIAIHMDSCSGPQLAEVPLQPAYRKDGLTSLPAVQFTSRQSGQHDLCFAVEDADPAIVWLLNYIQPQVQ